MGIGRLITKRIGFVALLVALAVAAFAPAAQAAPGLITTFGEDGTEAEDFFYPGPTAVDAAEGNSIFIANLTTSFEGRLRKFDSAGNLLGSAIVSDFSNEELIDSIAVDESEHRVYVLLSGPFGGASTTKILAYSTTPNASGELTFAPGVPGGVLYDFTADGGGLFRPQAMAVDSGTDKLVIVGQTDPSDPTSSALRYVTDAGGLSTEVTGIQSGIDLENVTPYPVSSIAVGPDGTVYFPSLFFDVAAGASRIGIFSMTRESAGATLLARSVGVRFDESALSGAAGFGSALAVSSDGSTLFVAEINGTGAGVRSFSTTTGKQRHLYEGGECSMPLPFTAVGLGAGSGGFFVATPATEEEPGSPAVYVFGDSGTACPSGNPAANVLFADGGAERAAVTKGESRTFEIEKTGLHGTSVAEVDWDFNGDGTYETQVAGGALTVTHKFTTSGTFHVAAKVILDTEPGEEAVSNPLAVQVSGLAPTASFKVSTKSPLTGEAVTFDASESRDLTGGPEGEAVKLGETGTYRWDFGDGSTLQTTKPITTHAFSTAGAHTVKLTVVSHEGLTSATPFTVAVTAVAPTPPPGDGGGGGETTPPPSTTPPATTPPVTTPPTTTPKVLTCKKGFIKSKGKCVKKSAHHKKKKKKK